MLLIILTSFIAKTRKWMLTSHLQLTLPVWGLVAGVRPSCPWSSLCCHQRTGLSGCPSASLRHNSDQTGNDGLVAAPCPTQAHPSGLLPPVEGH